MASLATCVGSNARQHAMAANFRRPWLEACGMGGAVLWRARVPARHQIPELPSLETSCRGRHRKARPMRFGGTRRMHPSAPHPVRETSSEHRMQLSAPGRVPMCVNPRTRNWADSILRTDADTQAMPICTLTVGMDSLDGVIHERHPRAGRGSTILPGAHRMASV